MTAAVPRRENALQVLLRIPVFRRMWAAIAFSSLGDWLGLLANTALAQQLTGEQSKTTQGVAIAGVLFFRLAPDLLFGAFAAVIADKLDRRKTVIVGELTAAVLYASIAIGYNLVWLYAAQFVIEAAGLFTQPAKQVIWVAIVPKKLLATANQISLFSVYGTALPAAGGFALLSVVNRLISGPDAADPAHVNAAIVTALLLNTLTFLVSATTVFVSRARISVVPAERERQQSVVSMLREGVSFVRGNALIRGLYVGIVGAFAAGGLTGGVALLWVATLSAGTAGYAIMFGTLFTGLAGGILLGPKVMPSYARSRVFGLAIGSAGIALLVASLIRNFILADGLVALIGAFAGIAWIIGYTLIGQEVEDRLRGRTFAFVLSSVRITLLLTLLLGPVLAGAIGSHAIPFGNDTHLRLSGPGLTLLLGGIVALLVSVYATSRSTRSPRTMRDALRRRVTHPNFGRLHEEHRGLFVSIEGVDPAVTAVYAALVADVARERGLTVLATAEPTDSPTGRRVAELLGGAFGEDTGPARGAADASTGPPARASVEPETAALLSAADRAEHVATVLRPALLRGDVVVCDRYALTSAALHGGGRGADVDRIRAVNRWGAGDLRPELSLVVDAAALAVAQADALTGGAQDLDVAAVSRTLLDAAAADPDRYVVCPPDLPTNLPGSIRERLARLLDQRVAPSGESEDASGAEREDVKPEGVEPADVRATETPASGVPDTESTPGPTTTAPTTTAPTTTAPTTTQPTSRTATR